MKSKQDIASIARKLFRHNTGARGIKLMHPNRDWFIGVLGAITIIVGMVGWSVFTYYEQREKISTSGELIPATVPAYRAEMVERALKVSNMRAAEFATFSNQNTPIVIPSVEDSETSATTSAATSTDEVVVSQPEEEEEEIAEPPESIEDQVNLDDEAQVGELTVE